MTRYKTILRLDIQNCNLTRKLEIS
jgi:hypothetical protein